MIPMLHGNMVDLRPGARIGVEKRYRRPRSFEGLAASHWIGVSRPRAFVLRSIVASHREDEKVLRAGTAQPRQAQPGRVPAGG